MTSMSKRKRESENYGGPRLLSVFTMHRVPGSPRLESLYCHNNEDSTVGSNAVCLLEMVVTSPN